MEKKKDMREKNSEKIITAIYLGHREGFLNFIL